MSYINPSFSYTEGVIKEPIPRQRGKVNEHDKHGYMYVRYGEPKDTSIRHEKVKEDIETLLRQFTLEGYDRPIPVLKNHEFRKHVAKFKATLDAWDNIPIAKVFCRDEIYVRCLSEGPTFTEFIKKSRATTLRGLTSLIDTDVEEDHFHPENYEGYDSIIHERNLIHWDDREDVDDVKYAFIPATGYSDGFEEMCERFLSNVKVGIDDFDLNVDALSELRNTKMHDPVSRKNFLMREFWNEDMDIEQPYFAKRVAVLTEPGSTRDTGVGTTSTVAKVKLVNKLCRTILERCTHSASAHSNDSAKRLKRVLERNVYIHLDFKKYGLSFPRVLMNIMLKVIGRKYHIDTNELLIDDFFVEIGKETFRTERGSMLGWMDCLNELCVHAILWHLSYDQGLRFDWIGFNDDFEISFYSGETTAAQKANMIRDVILSACFKYDLLVSANKTYASMGSIFLEKYFRFDREYDLDMSKRQLGSRSYGRSLVQQETWLAKIYFAAAYAVYPDEDLATRCIATAKIEFSKEEWNAPLIAGGWYPNVDNVLDHSLSELSHDQRGLVCELMDITLPDISQKPTNIAGPEKARESLIKRIASSKDPESGRERFEFRDSAAEINIDADASRYLVPLRLATYNGKNEDFVQAYTRAMEALHPREIFDPG